MAAAACGMHNKDASRGKGRKETTNNKWMPHPTGAACLATAPSKAVDTLDRHVNSDGHPLGKLVAENEAEEIP